MKFNFNFQYFKKPHFTQIERTETFRIVLHSRNEMNKFLNLLKVYPLSRINKIQKQIYLRQYTPLNRVKKAIKE